ncbi:unnamed protein product [Bemisia tabaci]|uniref:Uncharacterized protein n=1 Tax=Bemisia tabaci TaxID=7038 RepID=A0A9P0ABN9_BEMTA|nr:unnamed protein product [Bemisia tabaci]
MAKRAAGAKTSGKALTPHIEFPDVIKIRESGVINFRRSPFIRRLANTCDPSFTSSIVCAVLSFLLDPGDLVLIETKNQIEMTSDCDSDSEDENFRVKTLHDLCKLASLRSCIRSSDLVSISYRCDFNSFKNKKLALELLEVPVTKRFCAEVQISPKSDQCLRHRNAPPKSKAEGSNSTGPKHSRHRNLS